MMKIRQPDGTIFELDDQKDLAAYWDEKEKRAGRAAAAPVVSQIVKDDPVKAVADNTVVQLPKAAGGSANSGFRAGRMSAPPAAPTAPVKTVPRKVFFTPTENKIIEKLAETYPEGMTSAEIAEHLKQPPQTGASTVSRLNMRLNAHRINLIHKKLPGSFYTLNPDVFDSITIEIAARCNVAQNKWDYENGY